MAVEPRRLLTCEDDAAFPDDGIRRGIVGGEVSEADRVEVFCLERGSYNKPQILEPGEMLTTPVLPGVAIDLAELLAR